eukprot:m.47692 g.47692  ORF g.47692 m.47692 type:complete len:195 (-) comp10784_c0_seq1:96-680(-)
MANATLVPTTIQALTSSTAPFSSTTSAEVALNGSASMMVKMFIPPQPPMPSSNSNSFNNTDSTSTESSSPYTESSDEKMDNNNSTSSSSAPKFKRGQYKCGRCGYFPKKQKHDCEKVKAQRAVSQNQHYHPHYNHQHHQQGFLTNSTAFNANTSNNSNTNNGHVMKKVPSFPASLQHMIITTGAQQAFQQQQFN